MPNDKIVVVSELDQLLVAQFAVAWAGEAGEGDDRRLGWWKTNLVSEFGGEDLYRVLLPESWQWAVLQSVREAARRADAAARQRDHDPDSLITIFSLGVETDERLEERLQDLKRHGKPPREALAGLSDAVTDQWDAEAFGDWVQGFAEACDNKPSPIGRLLKGDPPVTIESTMRRLVGALLPFSSKYPLPHFRRPS